MVSIVFAIMLFVQPTTDIDVSELAPEAASAITLQLNKSTLSQTDWHDLAVLYHAHGMQSEAIDAYTYARTLSLTLNSKTSYLLALALARVGNYEEAIKMAESCVQYMPSVWRRGYWHMDLGEFEQATNLFTRAISDASDCVPAIIGLARVKLAAGNPQEAIVLLDDIILRGGDHPYLTFLLGTAHRRAGNHTLATQLLANPAAGPPRWPDPWLDEMQAQTKGYSADLSRATAHLEANNPASAKSVLESLAKRYPKDAPVANNLATVYLQLQQTKLAENTLKKSMRWNPQYAPMQLTMAFVMKAKGDIQLSLAYAKKAIQLQPAMSSAYAHAGRISFQLQDMTSAVKFFAKAMELGNSDPSIREMYAMVLLNTGKPDLALIQFDLVLQTIPLSVRSICGKAIALALMRQPDAGLKLLAEAKLKFPNDQGLARAWQSVLQIKGRQ
jgi:tetratricopeptide (TPR) repeat protein